LYYLVNDVSEALEYFVQTGKQPEEDRGTNREYHVFPCEREAAMIAVWRELGMTVTYHRQQVELTNRITVAYMNVVNPKTSMNISMIPWFMVVGRPYPIFAYAYAIGYYQRAEKKSLAESAAAVRKLFGIRSFHKSTVSRSISAMEEFLDASQLDRPLSADALRDPACLAGSQTGTGQADESIVEQVSELLTAYPSLEALEKASGEKVRPLPKPVRRTDRISRALSDIPDERFNIILRREPGGRPSRDRRKRPPRPRNKGSGHVQRPLKFVDYPQREEERKAIIAICRRLALDAAATCHRFLV
jgi:hypothetical protein